MRCDEIWYILRHNFEKCSSVCTDLVASGWFFRYSFLYTVMITTLLGGGGSWARCVWDVSSWNVPQRRWARRDVCRSQATLTTILKFASRAGAKVTTCFGYLLSCIRNTLFSPIMGCSPRHGWFSMMLLGTYWWRHTIWRLSPPAWILLKSAETERERRG